MVKQRRKLTRNEKAIVQRKLGTWMGWRFLDDIRTDDGRITAYFKVINERGKVVTLDRFG